MPSAIANKSSARMTKRYSVLRCRAISSTIFRDLADRSIFGEVLLGTWTLTMIDVDCFKCRFYHSKSEVENFRKAPLACARFWGASASEFRKRASYQRGSARRRLRQHLHRNRRPILECARREKVPGNSEQCHRVQRRYNWDHCCWQHHWQHLSHRNQGGPRTIPIHCHDAGECLLYVS